MPPLPSIVEALKGNANAGVNWRQVVLSAAVTVWATRRAYFPSFFLREQ